MEYIIKEIASSPRLKPEKLLITGRPLLEFFHSSRVPLPVFDEGYVQKQAPVLIDSFVWFKINRILCKNRAYHTHKYYHKDILFSLGDLAVIYLVWCLTFIRLKALVHYCRNIRESQYNFIMSFLLSCIHIMPPASS